MRSERMVIPATDYVPVIGNNQLAADADLSDQCRGLYNGGATAKVEVELTGTPQGTTRVLPLPAGMIIAGFFRKIHAGADTTATNLFEIR